MSVNPPPFTTQITTNSPPKHHVLRPNFPNIPRKNKKRPRPPTKKIPAPRLAQGNSDGNVYTCVTVPVIPILGSWRLWNGRRILHRQRDPLDSSSPRSR